MGLLDIERKIRLTKRDVNKLTGNTHIEFVVKTHLKSVLDILEDMREILKQQDEAIRAMPRSP